MTLKRSKILFPFAFITAKVTTLSHADTHRMAILDSHSNWHASGWQAFTLDGTHTVQQTVGGCQSTVGLMSVKSITDTFSCQLLTGLTLSILTIAVHCDGGQCHCANCPAVLAATILDSEFAVTLSPLKALHNRCHLWSFLPWQGTQQHQKQQFLISTFVFPFVR